MFGKGRQTGGSHPEIWESFWDHFHEKCYQKSMQKSMAKKYGKFMKISQKICQNDDQKTLFGAPRPNRGNAVLDKHSMVLAGFGGLVGRGGTALGPKKSAQGLPKRPEAALFA